MSETCDSPMSTQERLKLAKRNRLLQLKRWREREEVERRLEKELNRSECRVHFVPGVMLLEAAARNDIDEVRRLLMVGVSPDSTNEDGLTALHQCCIDGSEAMLRMLLEFGANVNAKDSEQWTPLHAAATCGHLPIVRHLIAKGADLLAVNADGNMPYDICDDDATLDCIENEMAHKGISQVMIDQTRSATETWMLEDLKNSAKESGILCSNGATPLHVAAANGYLRVLEFLLGQHVPVDPRDADQWQPLHAAACWGHAEAIEVLVQAGADINAKTKNGETPYDIAEDVEVRERILQLKLEMETKKGSVANRLKRSHSHNTRSQSIRRTSIRERGQISRLEARQEALMRQDHTDEGVDPKDIELSFAPKDQVEPPLDPVVKTNPGQSVNVQIHVTVNTSPLANGVSPHLPRKFHGVEVVGQSKHKNRCCSCCLM